MSVTYKFLSKEQYILHLVENVACFYNCNAIQTKHNATYFAYKINKNALTENWINYINSLGLAKRIPVKTVIKTGWYTVTLHKITGYELFLNLTLLRYLDEETKIINCVLDKNQFTNLSPIHRLLAAHRHTVNWNHTIYGIDRQNKYLSYSYTKPKSVTAYICPIHKILHKTFKYNPLAT